ncbi:hypothetical protein CU254_24640 [Amycolatopsis sp. AA4]|nr:hypothetical protein CU254_24640 [Amycolatopsis sp. AA4]
MRAGRGGAAAALAGLSGSDAAAGPLRGWDEDTDTPERLPRPDPGDPTRYGERASPPRVW